MVLCADGRSKMVECKQEQDAVYPCWDDVCIHTAADDEHCHDQEYVGKSGKIELSFNGDRFLMKLWTTAFFPDEFLDTYTRSNEEEHNKDFSEEIDNCCEKPKCGVIGAEDVEFKVALNSCQQKGDERGTGQQIYQDHEDVHNFTSNVKLELHYITILNNIIPPF